MKISTKGRYALRLMLDLACNQDGTYITIKNISQRQNISDKYLEQIITQLSKADFVKSARGAQGGYMLAKDPKDYTVGEILRLLEGDLAPVVCVNIDSDHYCDRADNCATKEVWQRIQSAVDQVVDNITLADLTEWQQAKCPNNCSTNK